MEEPDEEGDSSDDQVGIDQKVTWIKVWRHELVESRANHRRGSVNPWPEPWTRELDARDISWMYEISRLRSVANAITNYANALRHKAPFHRVRIGYSVACRFFPAAKVADASGVARGLTCRRREVSD
jgi:hypothetical protein